LDINLEVYFFKLMQCLKIEMRLVLIIFLHMFFCKYIIESMKFTYGLIYFNSQFTPLLYENRQNIYI
jgi:hypothetical protein